MKELIKVIEGNNDVLKFAEHFKTKSSIKNLLQGLPNPKILSKVFDNKTFTDDLMGYDNISKSFVTIVTNAMEMYTGQYINWRSDNTVPKLAKRVDFFMGIIDDVMCDKTSAIGDILGKFAKTDTGLKIESIVKEAVKEAPDDKSDDVMMNLLVAMAVRETINKALELSSEEDQTNSDTITDDKSTIDVDGSDEVIEVFTGDVVDTESEKPISETHKEFHQKEQDEPRNETHTLKCGFESDEFIHNLTDTIGSLSFNSLDEEIDSITKNIYPYIINGMDKIAKMINDTNVTGDWLEVIDLLPVDHIEYINGVNIDKLISLIYSSLNLQIFREDMMENDCVRAVAVYTSCLAIELIKTPNDSNKFYKFARIIVRILSNPSYMMENNRKKIFKEMRDIESLVKRVYRMVDKPRSGHDADIHFMKEMGCVPTRSIFRGIYRMVRNEAA